jgi:hypothetical protein
LAAMTPPRPEKCFTSSKLVSRLPQFASSLAVFSLSHEVLRRTEDREYLYGVF